MHAAAVRADGTLLTWGRNDFGQLGNGGTTDTNRPTVVGQGYTAVACGDTFTLALDRSGQISRLQNGVFTQVPGGPWTGVAAQGSLALAVKGDGELWAWGRQWSNQGQLDYGDTPVLLGVGFQELAIGIDHVLALKADGSLWGWGGNDMRQLGIEGGFRPTPTLIANGPFKAVHAGWKDGAALDTKGAVWAWGVSWGPTPVAIAQGYESLSATGSLLALRADGMAWQLLNGAVGQPANPFPVPGRYALLGSGDSSNSLAIGVDGSLLIWGADNAGQLGIGSAVNQTLPRSVGAGWRQLSSAPAQARAVGLKMDGSIWELGGYQGNATTPQAMTGFPGTGYVAVAAGGTHTLALRADGSLWAAGRNDKGQLGDGTTLSREQAVQIGAGYKEVAAGFDHSVALKTDGTVWTWGGNGNGQLGDGSTTDRSSPVKVGEQFVAVFAHAARSFGLDAHGAIWGWGKNDQAQIGNGNTQDQARPVRIEGRFRTLAAGPMHTLGLDEDGRLWAWGANYWRGFGTPEPYEAKRPTLISNGLWLALAAGDFHSAGMRADGSIWSWGWNLSGALGNGTFLQSLETPRPVLNEAGTDQLDLTPATPIELANRLLPYFAVAKQSGIDLQAQLTDLRAAGLSGDVFFSVLLPKDSPLLSACSLAPCSAAPRKRRASASAPGGMVAGVLTRQGFKQTSGGGAATAASAYNGNLGTGAALDVYTGLTSDPLAQSKAVICMGVTVPELSAKGQVLMLPIATGTEVKSAVQCPPVQTASTVARFRAETSGPITARTIVTEITPLPEERGQLRRVYSWAVTPDGQQYMQTASGAWVPMAESMQAAATVTLPLSGTYRFETTKALNLSTFVGTLVFVGLGESWEDVRNLNKAAQHYTVQ